jgi:hypothetical protein
MRLSRQELGALDEIGRGLHSDDPALAATLTTPTTDTVRRRRVAWSALWIGLVVMIAGDTAACGLISGGTIVGFYGLGLLLLAASTLLRDLARQHGRRDGRRIAPSPGVGFNP